MRGTVLRMLTGVFALGEMSPVQAYSRVVNLLADTSFRRGGSKRPEEEL